MVKYYSKSLGGFPDPTLFGTAMPSDAVEISAEQYDALMAGQIGGGIAHDDGGSLIVIDPLLALTLEEIKVRKLAELSAECSACMDAVKSGYPIEEVQSWDKQELEARAYAADSAVATPLLSALAAARDITLTDLVARVIAKADAFAVASGTIIGRRQKCEDAVIAATNVEAVLSVVWGG